MSASAQAPKKNRPGASAIALGIRQHSDYLGAPNLPYGEGDLSYLVAYEYHEGNAYWQIGLGYTPHSTTTSTVEKVESVMTPQIHLLLKDRIFYGGLGLMRSYVRREESHWTDFVWQLQFGAHFPLSEAFDLQLAAYYLFEEWGDIGDFNTDNVELGMSLSYRY
jgi:hypothetical protein